MKIAQAEQNEIENKGPLELIEDHCLYTKRE